MVKSVASVPITPVRPRNAESSGVLASRSQSLFAASLPNVAPPNIFGAETSGSMACGSSGSSGGGGNTVAVA